MSTPTVVFITGVSKGIGKALAESYLAQPHHTVIGSVRQATSPEIEALKAFKAADGSKLVLVQIESQNPGDAAKAVQEIQSQGISHLDIVIANAGGSPPMVPLDQVGEQDMLTGFRTNALAPLYLYQATKSLMEKSGRPRWVSVSTVASSMTLMEKMGTQMTPAYGTSKAALNWITQAIYCSNAWLTTLLVHPGLTQTGPGNWVAQQIGMAEAPYTIQKSVDSLVALIDGATRDKDSAKLLDANEGTVMPL